MDNKDRTPDVGEHTRPVKSRSTPINDTFWRRLLTRATVRLVTTRGIRRLFKHPGGVLFFSNFCIKCSPFTVLAEANAMQFVREHTSIPVPTVYSAFTHKETTYTVMERIHGKMLASGWALRSEESQARILRQLKDMVGELRRIPPPDSVGVVNVDGGPVYDCRLQDNFFWEPFETIRIPPEAAKRD